MFGLRIDLRLLIQANKDCREGIVVDSDCRFQILGEQLVIAARASGQVWIS